ncbi:MAG: sugar transferase [Patescibacteria group bacterium]
MHAPYRMKQFMLLIGDILCFGIGFLLGISIRNLELPAVATIEKHGVLFLMLFFLWIVINFINGLYDLDRLPDPKRLYRRMAEACVMSFVVGILFFYLIPEARITPKTILLLNVLFGYACSAIWRRFFHRIVGTKTLRTNVIIVGYTPEAKEIVNVISQFPEKGYSVAAIIDPERTIKGSDFPGIDVYHTIQTIRPSITNYHVQLVVIAPHIRHDETALRELYELLFWPVQIIDLPSFYETITGRIPPSTFSEGWFLDHLKNREQPIYDKIRTFVDYLAGVLIGSVMIVLFPIIALAIKIGSPGPIFFKQKRIGKFGKIFNLYKFRSMYALSPDGSAEMEGAEFAKKDDKRITPMGSIIRKFRIDEWPQALNLLRRDITLIGPRPERPEIVSQLQSMMPYYALRHTVRPGLTGWALIHQNYTDTIETSLTKLQYDLFYIKNRSFLLDLSIALRTVNVVVRMMGQ